MPVPGAVMNANLSTFFLAAGAVFLTAVSVLILLVRNDLAPAGRYSAALSGHGRWFLGAALGIGVIAFAIKLVIIGVLALFPAQTVTPLIADVGKRVPSADPWIVPDSGAGQLTFQALPAIAPAPPDNPTTPEKVALGKRLFQDPLLSWNQTVSCQSCHNVDTGAGADARMTAIGISGIPGRRNTPTVFNAAFQARLFWDGRAASLEEQALGPLLNPDEMGMPSATAIEERVAADPAYREAFAQAFGPQEPIVLSRIAQAIAAYERSLITADTPYDRFVSGDALAMTPAQQRGMWLFQSLGCMTCHSGANFSGAARIGPQRPYAPLLAQRSDYARRYALMDDKGKAGTEAATGIWRIPSLRNVALTAPYLHNGQGRDLAEVVRIMATAQLNARISEDSHQRHTPQWSAERKIFTSVDRIILDSRDIDDLVAFLTALSSDTLARRPAIAGP